MTRIYEVRELPGPEGPSGIFHATVRSDDEGWVQRVCEHDHRSRKQAERCVHKAYRQANLRPAQRRARNSHKAEVGRKRG
jgi:hypothetical protein